MRIPVALFATLLACPAPAQVERLDHAVTASGLSVEFPAGLACTPVASPFASPTRHDGSPRLSQRNSGLHGGLDISLEPGTPLLAAADGEVIAAGEGGALEGIYLWLRHTPADTGTPYHVFSKYQHLGALPALKAGDRVAAGSVVGVSGATGTAGRHYGPEGYPHLHWSTFFGPSPEFELKGLRGSMVSGKGAHLDDPLYLYLDGLGDLAAARGLADEQRRVRPAVVVEDGRMQPPGRKTVWPVACRRG